MERKAAVAGQFYPGSRSALETEVARLLDITASPRKVLGAVSPHAGYFYSGAVAGKVFGSIIVPPRAIILCPNHTGMGERAAVFASGSWSLPTGSVPVDEGLAQRLLARTDRLQDDPAAHIAEHSLEVQLPFMLARQPMLSIVPIAISRIGLADCMAIGETIAEVVADIGEDVLIVASSDMNHYEDEARTRSKDQKAIDEVLALHPKGLIETCAEHRISMCGVLPTAIAIAACTKLGARKATLVAHTTSGDVSGDHDAVVGYAGFLIE